MNAIPHISFTMDTRKGAHQPAPASLSEGMALGLSEKISSSIHLRPTELPKAAAMESFLMPTGIHALAGEICPRSSWRQWGSGCNGTGVMGGQRQYIKQGERMPQALVLFPPSLWKRGRDLQPSFKAKERTSWSLVEQRTRDDRWGNS